MGIYIQAPSLNAKGGWLVTHEGARYASIDSVPGAGEVLICEVLNPAGFSACAILFDNDERRDFTDPNDVRPKRFFIMDRGRAFEIAGQPDPVGPDGKTDWARWAREL